MDSIGTAGESKSLDHMVRGTVVVVDMTAYSDIAKMLEENLTAGAVAELNRQIQAFMDRSLAQLPNGHTYCVVSRPGDGIIVLFEESQDAHCFGFHVHVFANEHNDQRSELIAERWFRVGIATGDVSVNLRNGIPEYAGITIANACRLEAAAGKGEILVDSHTFSALPAELKRLYSSEESIKGKRSEKFLARRCRVALSSESVPVLPRFRLDRRHFIVGTGIAIIASTLGGWSERDLLYSWLHPLPAKRHVALLAWPPPRKEDRATLASVLDSIHNRLSRAESYVQQLLIVTADDMSDSPSDVPKTLDSPQDAQQRALEWEANLILGIQIIFKGQQAVLELSVIDAIQMNLLRTRRTPVEFPTSVNRLASDSAARLLDLSIAPRDVSDEDELSTVPAPARALYDEALLFARDPNGVRQDEAVEKFQETLNAHPRFALAYSGLGRVYLRQFEKIHDPSVLTLAGNFIERALQLNPSSEKAILSKARFWNESGQSAATLTLLSPLLKNDPQNSEALYLKAIALSQTNPPQPSQEIEVYRYIVQCRPNYWLAYNALGTCLHDQGQDKEAVEQFKAASALMPRATTPLINLGALYMAQGRDDDAKKTLEQSNTISKNHTALEYLGDIYFKQRNYIRSLAYYLEADELNPNDHYVLSALGDCYQMLNQPQKVNLYYTRAGEQLSRYLQINPHSGNLWMTLALYDAKIGRAKASERDMSKANSYGANDVESSLLKARALAVLGRMLEAKTIIFSCLNQGLAPEEVELAPELGFVRKDPGYAKHLKS